VGPAGSRAGVVPARRGAPGRAQWGAVVRQSAATTAGRRLDVLDAARLLGACVVLATYDADQAGADGRAYLRSLSERVVAVEPPAHDLTAYWQAGGNLRAWIAALVAQHMERLLDRLDMHRHAGLFVRWLEIYNQALAVQDAQEAGRVSPFHSVEL